MPSIYEIYDSDEHPFLYIDEKGALCIGEGYVIHKLDDIDEVNYFINRISLALKVLSPGIPFDKLLEKIPDSDIEKIMTLPPIKELLDALSQLPFRDGADTRLFKGERLRFMLIQISPAKKIADLKDELFDLLKRSVLTRAKLKNLHDPLSIPSHIDRFNYEPLDRSYLMLRKKDLDNIGLLCHPNLGKEAASLVLDFIPFVGSVKAIAQIALKSELFTKGRIIMKEELLGLLPLAKIFTKSKQFSRLYRLIKQNRQVNLRNNDLIRGKTPGYNFTGRVDQLAFRRNAPGGHRGTFITDQDHIEDAVGPIDTEATVLEITEDQANQLAENLGISSESVRYGGTLKVIDDAYLRNPRLPPSGSHRFKGMGKGLPGSGPEVEISAINNTSIEPQIREIVIKIKDMSMSERRLLSTAILNKLRRIKGSYP